MQNSNLFGRKLILNNFSKAANNFIFIYMNQSPHKPVSSVGFFLANANYAILLAGCAPFPTNTNFTDDLTSMNIALQVAPDLQTNIHHISLSMLPSRRSLAMLIQLSVGVRKSKFYTFNLFWKC